MDNPYFIINSLWAQARHGRGRLFQWDHSDNKWSLHAVRGLLSKRGVFIYAGFTTGANGRASCRVNDRQADWAESILRAAGVPIAGPVRAEALSEVPQDVGGRAKSRDPIGHLQDSIVRAVSGKGYDDVPKEIAQRKSERAERRAARRNARRSRRQKK